MLLGLFSVKYSAAISPLCARGWSCKPFGLAVVGMLAPSVGQQVGRACTGELTSWKG